MTLETIAELERRLAPIKTKGSPDEFARLVAHLESEAGTARDPRARQAHWRRAGHFCGRAFAAGENDPTRLANYARVVRQAAAASPFPQDLLRLASKVTKRWLQVTGAPEATVTTRRTGSIDTEVASFVLCDETEFHDWQSAEDAATRIAAARSGRQLHILLAADGRYPAELRIVDGHHPLLAFAEYSRLRASLDPVVLSIPSGRVVFGMFQGPLTGRVLRADVEPGCWLCAVYGFSTARSDKIVVVMARHAPVVGDFNPEFADAALFA